MPKKWKLKQQKAAADKTAVAAMSTENTPALVPNQPQAETKQEPQPQPESFTSFVWPPRPKDDTQ